MKSKIILLGAVSAMALSACSSSQDAAMPGSSDAVNVSYIYKRERVKEQISYVPEWFKEQPTDSENIFSVGTSVTPDMQFAIDAAILNAKVVLADRINSRLRSQTKQFKAKVGSGDFDSSLIFNLKSIDISFPLPFFLIIGLSKELADLVIFLILLKSPF